MDGQLCFPDTFESNLDARSHVGVEEFDDDDTWQVSIIGEDVSQSDHSNDTRSFSKYEPTPAYIFFLLGYAFNSFRIHCGYVAISTL
jgi:hypothetical protein